jgi:hypothetical protein
MMQDVRSDDIKQFQGKWAQKPLTEALIFSDTQKCIDAVHLYYQDTFRDLVYSNDIPNILLIMRSIENIYKSLINY